MSHVGIHSLTKRFDGKPPTTPVDDLDLEIEEGEFLVLLGPSGCGKTTTLRCLAGLETPSTGQITFGSTTMFDAARRVNVSPEKRNIGMVFQSYALWPHLTVRKNIRLSAQGTADQGGHQGGLGRGDRRTRRLRSPARPLSGAAQRWPAATRRSRPRARRSTRPRAVRRAAEQSRRPPA